MNWHNVRLIFAREIRDQLRDRRTLFMIAVLPLLLYPLLGMSVFQLSQFMRKHEARVMIVGAEPLAADKDLPPLFTDQQFDQELVGDSNATDQLLLEFRALDQITSSVGDDAEAGITVQDDPLLAARQFVATGAFDAVVYFPADFAARLQHLSQALDQRRAAEGSVQNDSEFIEIPKPQILFNSASDKSRVAQMRVERLLEHWRSMVARQHLVDSRVPVNIARPFDITPLDTAEKRQRDAALWSKVLPFVLFVWALTGAFYPSVDLCPGEKERGTLETLLSSPALRSEIVWGKLLTIMTFSIATALLNLISLGLTAQYVISQLRSIADFGDSDGLAFPPPIALLWLLLALLPMAAMFSALCLACAAFARSTKEGQYYFMPLFMVTMPLMILPMSPGVQLDLGNSLIPVTGVVLLLRSLIEGHYASVLPYVFPVVGMTALCCLLAIRWAIEQFQQESVLFRESERLDLRRWVLHLVRDRTPTPMAAQAFACVALILVIQFFVRLSVSTNVPAEPGFNYLALVVFISQVVCIALPAIFMTMFLTSRPQQTLLLSHMPSFVQCAVAVLLAVLLHPLGQQLAIWISQLYPVSDEVIASSRMMVQMFESAPYAWLPFLLIAVLPGVCEELAFRGFILSGFRHLGHKWWAIGLSAVFFGLAHTVLQQSLAAIVLGVALGFLAVQTGSLIPCMLFHMTYNGLMLLSTRWAELPESVFERIPALRWVLSQTEPGQVLYSAPLMIACGVLAAGLFYWLHRLPYQQTEEERIQHLRDRQLGQTPAEVSLEAASGAQAG